MKKLLSLTLVSVILGVSVVAQADTYVANTAKNQRGEAVFPEYGGFDATRIGSPGILGEQVVCIGRCVLGAAYLSTGVAGRRVLFFDTSVAGNMSPNTQTLSIPYGPEVTSSAMNRISRTLRFSKGISVRIDGGGTAEDVTVGTVDLDQR